MYFYVEPGNSF